MRNASANRPPAFTPIPISSILSGPPSAVSEGKENNTSAAPSPLPILTKGLSFGGDCHRIVEAARRATAPTNSRKRKSTDGPAPTEETVNLDDIIVEDMPITENCDQIRRKINRLIDSGTMTKTAFARELGISAKSLGGFLAGRGPYGGCGYAAYDAAGKYFNKREVVVLKPPVKKMKMTHSGTSVGSAATKAAGPALNSAGLDLSDIVLPGEEDDAVPVFDSCDEVRRKINLQLKKPGVTQAQFCRDILAQLKSPRRPNNIQGSQLARFRGNSGALSGCMSSVFYGAYVFFEKVRIKEGKPKTKHRLEMEKAWPEGLDREHDGRSAITCFEGEIPHLDELGKLYFK
ncbi:hypothetical protein B0H67DRAFT_639458 [Lasiosphaeris hirsuta]|uniref:DUF7726 domain-containing protein n=1 Tax=Lasiosphaeris hirsuta TaxID=260670 RepID=A0AA40BB53_9PEZI|nr:hypothetical protein B0H67DRAFT_639458 [Lasiosphaeris hirsuta]